MSITRRITPEELDGLVEILESDVYELGPQDRELMLFLVQLFRYGLDESAVRPDDQPKGLDTHQPEERETDQLHEEDGECPCSTLGHCPCYQDEGKECCGCGATHDN